VRDDRFAFDQPPHVEPVVQNPANVIDGMLFDGAQQIEFNGGHG
jgi:hypothetical protein